jgi:hypothetical protein
MGRADVRVKRKLGSVLGTAGFTIALAGGLGASPAASAAAQQPAAVSNQNQLESELPADAGHCVDLIGGTTLGLATCEGAQNQEWGIGTIDGPVVRLQNAFSGGCLAVRTVNGSQALAMPGCNTSDTTQQWTLEGSEFVNRRTALCLTSGPNFHVGVATCINNGSSSQMWFTLPK